MTVETNLLTVRAENPNDDSGGFRVTISTDDDNPGWTAVELADCKMSDAAFVRFMEFLVILANERQIAPLADA